MNLDFLNPQFFSTKQISTYQSFTLSQRLYVQKLIKILFTYRNSRSLLASIHIFRSARHSPTHHHNPPIFTPQDMAHPRVPLLDFILALSTALRVSPVQAESMCSQLESDGDIYVFSGEVIMLREEVRNMWALHGSGQVDSKSDDKEEEKKDEEEELPDWLKRSNEKEGKDKKEEKDEKVEEELPGWLKRAREKDEKQKKDEKKEEKKEESKGGFQFEW